MQAVLFLSCILSLSPCLADPGKCKTPQNYVMKKMVVTAYCPNDYQCCGKWARLGLNRKLPDGTPLKIGVRQGAIAAPKSIPMGTKIAVPGYKGGEPIPVRDRGGAIKGNRLDLLYPTHKEARHWGKRTLEVKIFNPAMSIYRLHLYKLSGPNDGVIPGKSVCTGDFTQ